MFLGQYFAAKMITTTSHLLRIRAFDRYLTLGKSFFDKKSIGGANVVFTTLISEVGQHFYHITTLAVHVIFSLSFLFLMASISWRLTLFALILIPFTQLVSVLLTKKLKSASESEVHQLVQFSKRSLDVLKNIELTILSGRQEDEMQRLGETSLQVARQGAISRSRRAAMPRLVDSINSTGIIILACCATFLFFKIESSSIGRISVFFITLRRFGTHMECFISSWAQCISNLPALERVIELFSEGEDSKIKDGKIEFTGVNSSIEFNNVSFSYAPNVLPDTLSNISFESKPSTMTALVGATGAGKTSLVSLLPRFYEFQQGEILIDGVSIRDFSLASLRKKIGFVSQNAQLFEMSIRDNLAYGRPDASDQEIEDAARRARILDYVMALPAQFEELIGENGLQLSGGERQRLSIARTLLCDPDILIFDEATSALDAETEQLVQEAIEELVEGRTVFVIAHRLATVKRADRILVMRDGKIIEDGSPRDLLASGGTFHKYFMLQNLNREELLTP